jgi:hypothetical protein
MIFSGGRLRLQLIVVAAFLVAIAGIRCRPILYSR